MDDIYRNTDFLSIGYPIKLPAKLEPMETLGDRVRAVREERDWTQKELAKKAKVAQSSISELETGAAKKSLDTVRLAVALGVSAYWLDSGKGPKTLGELEQSILELDEHGQQTIMDMIGVLKARRAA